MAGGQAIDLLSVGHRRHAGLQRCAGRHRRGRQLGVAPGAGCLRASDGPGVPGRADILAVTADTASLGKTPGKDAAENKPTYVSLLGLSEARAFADELREAALAALAPLGDAGGRLAQLADFIVLRDR
ncbi:hypothetical protein G6F59_017674 [Rhizopus arrhizus]|nr:hypothetical protein G6F59_017674 [Rhizopus arrhizus]